jgi:hypothetical protein
MLQHTNYVLIAESGVYTIFGTTLAPQLDRRFAIESGTYNIFGTDLPLVRTAAMFPESGIYTIFGTDVRVYQSAFFYGDAEMIWVPPEVRTMRLAPEPRDMHVEGKPEPELVGDEPGLRAPPRLRRT